MKIKNVVIDELKLMRGSPVEIKGMGMYHSFSLGDLEAIGIDKYENWLHMLTIDGEDLKKMLNIDEDKNFSTFDFILANCIHGDGAFMKDVIEAFSYMFRTPVTFSEQGHFIVGENDDCHVISEDNYETFRAVLRLANCIDNKEDVVENPSNSKAAEILRKRKEARKKLKEAKGAENEGEPLTWGDLVSILCANGNGITLENVWGLSIYAFNKQFARMQMLEEYDIGIRSLLAGAKKEDIELKHWMSAI